MEQLGIADWAQAAGAYTPAVTIIIQWIKQSPHWRNSWCVWAAPIIGLLLAVSALIAADQLQIVDGALLVNKMTGYKEVIKGIFAGVLALVGYDVQKQLPFTLLKSGPDNYKADRPADSAPPAQVQGG